MAQPPEPSALQMFVSLLPVIAGGVIGIAGGLAGTAFGRYLQNKQDRQNVRRSKMETIVLHLSDIEGWANQIRHHFIFEEGERQYVANPSSRVLGLTAVYFPELYGKAKELDQATDAYELALMSVRTTQLEAGQAAMAQGFAENKSVEAAKLAARQARLLPQDKLAPMLEAHKALTKSRLVLLKEAQALALTL